MQYTPEPTFGPKHYGRVMYVHGGGIDQPVAVVRSEYSDSLPRGMVYPLANHKGQYDMGISTCVLVTPRSPLLTEHHGEQQIGTDTVTHQIGDTRPYEHCFRGLHSPSVRLVRHRILALLSYRSRRGERTIPDDAAAAAACTITGQRHMDRTSYDKKLRRIIHTRRNNRGGSTACSFRCVLR